MNLPSELLRQAAQLASAQTVRRVEIFAEIGQLESIRRLSDAERTRLAALQQEAANCGQALTRLGAYRPHSDPEPNCPACWIVRGANSALRPNEAGERYLCGNCHREIPVMASTSDLGGSGA